MSLNPPSRTEIEVRAASVAPHCSIRQRLSHRDVALDAELAAMPRRMVDDFARGCYILNQLVDEVRPSTRLRGSGEAIGLPEPAE